MYKPLVPYSAKDIGLFFLRFYIIVVIFGVFWVHFFLSHESFCQLFEFHATTNPKNTKDDNNNRTQSHNLYVRAALPQHCAGWGDDWVPALHAQVLSHDAPLEICYDCQQSIQQSTGRNTSDIGGFGTNRREKAVAMPYPDSGIEVPPRPIVLQQCNCTTLSNIWSAWRTNMSKPLEIMLLEDSSWSWASHIKPACGPFVGYRVGYDALTNKMSTRGKDIFNTVIAEPSALTIMLIIIIGLGLLYLYRGNTMEASEVTSEHEQLRLRTECEGLRSRNNAIQQQLNLRRKQQAAMLKKE